MPPDCWTADSRAALGLVPAAAKAVGPGFVGPGQLQLPPESPPKSMPVRPGIREPSRTFESFILLPLPGVVADRSARPDLGHIPRQRQALLQRTGPRCSRWFALAAGRHHITNFDADSARDAARRTLLQIHEP